MENAAVFSFGSDRTDGPTDAALRENNTYPALKQIGGLIMTGPTGTNVNDVAVALLG